MRLICLLTAICVGLGLLLPNVLPGGNRAVAGAVLTGEILSPEIIGVDANNPSGVRGGYPVGPDRFIVHARISNEGASPATNLVATFEWADHDPYIALDAGQLAAQTLPGLASGEEADFFWVIQVVREKASIGADRNYFISLDSDQASETLSGYVKAAGLIEQCEDYSIIMDAPTSVNIGDTFTVIAQASVTRLCYHLALPIQYDPAVMELKSVRSDYYASRDCSGCPAYTETDFYYYDGTRLPYAGVRSHFTFKAKAGGSSVLAALEMNAKNLSSVHYDGSLWAGSVTVLVNTAPVAQDDFFACISGAPSILDVLANDSDPDGDPLLVCDVVDPPSGSVSNNGDSITYTPDLGFTGTDTFSYSIDDGRGGVDSASVTVLVSSRNHPPVAVDDLRQTEEDAPLVISVLANDFDPDGDALTITAVSNPDNGSAVNQGTAILYTPDQDFHGVDAFTYTCSDGRGGMASGTVTVEVLAVNDAPVAVDDSAATDEDVAVAIDVLANDYDVDGDTLAIIGVTAPMHGSAAIDGNRIIYQPAPGFSGNDEFEYTVDDGNGGQGTGTVYVSVSNVNKLPVAVDDEAATLEGTPVLIWVLINDTDSDGDTLYVQKANQPAHGTVVNMGNHVEYTPYPGFNGIDAFTYVVADGHGGTDTGTVTVTVVDVNDPPHKPDNLYPTDGEVDIYFTPRLEASAFSDPDDGDVHHASRWQVTAISGDYSSPIFDSGDDTVNLSSISMSPGILTCEATYYWRVKYQDDKGTWSDWSDETCFVTSSGIVFADPNLEAAVREAIGKPAGPICPPDLLGLRKLDASDRGIENLGGIEFLVDIGCLDLSWNDIVDIQPLVDSLGVNAWDLVDLRDNPLSDHSLNDLVPILWDRWVIVLLGHTEAPAKPVNILPEDGATGLESPITLSSSTFHDPDGKPHGASQWQISTMPGDGFEANIVFDSGVDCLHLTSLTLSSLPLGNTYYWRVRYHDDHDTKWLNWSEWSDPTCFSTPGPFVTITPVPISPTRDGLTTVGGIAIGYDGGIIQGVYYRVDGGPWQPAEPGDGLWDQNAEGYRFTILLDEGTHLVEVAAKQDGCIWTPPAEHAFFTIIVDNIEPQLLPTGFTGYIGNDGALFEAWDNPGGSGVTAVLVILKNLDDGTFWSPTGWGSTWKCIPATYLAEEDRWIFHMPLGVRPGTQYQIEVTAVDLAGNLSDPWISPPLYFDCKPPRIMIGTVDITKSVYLVADHHANPTPINAYGLPFAGYPLEYQQTYEVVSYAGGASGLAMFEDPNADGDISDALIFVTYEFSNLIEAFRAVDFMRHPQSPMVAAGAVDLAGIVVDQGKRLIYTVDRRSNKLYIYDADTFAPLPGSPRTLNTDKGAWGLALDEINDRLFVTDCDSTVHVYDTNTWAALPKLNVASKVAISVAYDEYNCYLYTSGAWADDFRLARYDMATGTATYKDLSYCTGAMALAVDPDTGLLYVTTGRNNAPVDQETNSLRVFDHDLNEVFIYPDTEAKILNTAAVHVPRQSIKYTFAECVNSLDLVNGIATDEGTVAKVELHIHDTTNFTYWNGSEWVADSVWLEADLDSSVDPNLWEYDSSMVTFQDGHYYIVVARAIDGAGNVGQSMSRFYFDLTAPALAATDPGEYARPDVLGGTVSDSSPCGVSSVEVRIEDLDAVTFWNGTAWAAGEAWLLAQLGTGEAADWTLSTSEVGFINRNTYRVTVRASDAVGNEAAIQFEFIYDGEAPTVTINDSMPEYLNNASLVSISGTAWDGLSGLDVVLVQLRRLADGRYWSNEDLDWVTDEVWNEADGAMSWSFPATHIGFVDGVYKVKASSLDIVGNRSAIAEEEFAIDRVVPAITIDSYIAGVLRGTATDAYPGQIDRVEICLLWMDDHNGDGSIKEGAEPSFWNWVTATWQDEEAWADTGYAAGRWSIGGGPIAADLEVWDSYEFTVKCHDKAGWATDLPYGFTGSQTGPDLIMDDLPDLARTLPLIGGTAGDEMDEIQKIQVLIQKAGTSYYWSSGGWITLPNWNDAVFAYNEAEGNYDWMYAGAVPLTNSQEYLVSARAIDRAGNVSATASDSFRADTLAPQLALNVPPYISSPQMIVGTATDLLSGVASVELQVMRTNAEGTFYWTGSAWVTDSGTFLPVAGAGAWYCTLVATTGLLEGESYLARVAAVDCVGNRSETSAYFVFDGTPPAVGIDGWQRLAGQIFGTASDEVSGMEALRLQIRNDTAITFWSGVEWVAADTWLDLAEWPVWRYMTEAPWTFVEGSCYTIEAWGRDAAGNEAADSLSFCYREGIPQVDIDPLSPYLNAMSEVTGSASDGFGQTIQDELRLVQVRIWRMAGADILYWSGSAWQTFDDAEHAWHNAVLTIDTASESPAGWSFDSSVMWEHGLTYTVEARVLDIHGSVGSDSTSFVFDTEAPAVVIDPPSNEVAPYVTGRATDLDSPITLVEYRIMSGGSVVVDWTPIPIVQDPADPTRYTFDFRSMVALSNGAYVVEVRATDAAGNEGTNSRAFSVNVQMTFTWHLKPGWNMISLPVVPVDTTASSLFKDLCYYILYEWDAATKQYVAADCLVPGRGYMIQVLYEKDVQISGGPVAQGTVELSEGWNLVGSAYKDTLIGDFLIVSMEPEGVNGYPIDDKYAIMGDNDFVLAGKSYWAYFDDDCTITAMVRIII